MSVVEYGVQNNTANAKYELHKYIICGKKKKKTILPNKP